MKRTAAKTVLQTTQPVTEIAVFAFGWSAGRMSPHDLVMRGVIVDGRKRKVLNVAAMPPIDGAKQHEHHKERRQRRQEQRGVPDAANHWQRR